MVKKKKKIKMYFIIINVLENVTKGIFETFYQPLIYDILLFDFESLYYYHTLV